MAWSSDPQFCMTYYSGVPLVTCRNSDVVDQIVVPKSGGFCKFLIKELHVTPLSRHLGVQKLTHALFQSVWWPKMYETVSSFVHLYMVCMQTKDSTAVPPVFLVAPFSPRISLLLMEH